MPTSVTILVDNRATGANLVAEHGFSAFIEHDGARILFDTGSSDAMFRNAESLGCNLTGVDAVVLSHGHYDHTGGLAAFLRINRTARIFLHSGAVLPRYGRKPGKAPHSIGMPRETAEALMQRIEQITWTTQPTRIAPGILVTGSIPRTTSYENPGGPFFTDQDAAIPDEIPDDQALSIETPRGIIVVTGCAHAGIVNTMKYVANRAAATTIHAVIGGLHLIGASADRLTATVHELNRFAVEKIIPCHCTGDEAIEFISTHARDRVMCGAAGLRIMF